MPRILFIAPHRPNRSPSQRFRFEQYIPLLERNGYECKLSYIVPENQDEEFYSPGHITVKCWILLGGAMKRMMDVFRSIRFDIVFIQREAFFTGTAFFEKLFKRIGARIIFDYDDAIWLDNVSEANRPFNWLKNPAKTDAIIRMADVVIAGNRYLADHAAAFNERVRVIPSTIDTDIYLPISKEPRNPLCIGWIGSHTTLPHFELVIPALMKIRGKYGERVCFKVIGASRYSHPQLGIQGIEWSHNDELRFLQTFDIGIMPLPDDEWSNGKCGMKGLQYMALEIPPVMSPVGVNREIIEDGVNGFLAKDTEEWVAKLTALIESPPLRRQLGEVARRTVVERYSVKSQQEAYLECLRETAK